VVRVTIQALAAVLGGTQSLHTNSMDEALALPTEASARLALRSQQVIGYESGATSTADPLGGSYYVERLTSEIENGAADYIRRIDDMGGALRAIEAGFIQKEIQDAAYAYQKAVEAGQQVIVGVNRFQMQEEERFDILRIDPAIEKNQKQRLVELRRGRDNNAVRLAREAIAQAARGRDNLMPLILDAVRKQATIGEISDTLRDVFGLYQETVML